MLKSTAIHLRCKTTAAEITPWIQITLSCTSRCWHRYLRLTDHCCSKICVPIYRQKRGHLKQDSVKATNTCFCLLTSSVFIKSMIHIELLKKQKFPKWYDSGGLWALRGLLSTSQPRFSHHCVAESCPSAPLTENKTHEAFRLQRNELWSCITYLWVKTRWLRPLTLTKPALKTRVPKISISSCWINR